MSETLTLTPNGLCLYAPEGEFLTYKEVLKDIQGELKESDRYLIQYWEDVAKNLSLLVANIKGSVIAAKRRKRMPIE